MPYKLLLYRHWKRLILVLTCKLQCLDPYNIYPDQYLYNLGFFLDKYTNTTSFYNLSTIFPFHLLGYSASQEISRLSWYCKIHCWEWTYWQEYATGSSPDPDESISLCISVMIHLNIVFSSIPMSSNSIKHILTLTRLLIQMHEKNTIKLHVQVFLRMDTWVFWNMSKTI